MLYVVPTPVGNLGDISFRAVEVLKSVDYILCEDTRTSKKLMNHYSIPTQLVSFHAHNEHSKLQQHIEALSNGQNIAMVSDAGTPGISDPGFLLVREAQKNNLKLTVLPGATALIPALVASGIPCDKFYFEGFLPVKKGRQTRLKDLALRKETIVLYESPHKIIRTLKDLGEYLGSDRTACVVREISKIHEEINVNSLAALLEDYSGRGKVRGEIVIVVSGC